MAPAVQVPNGTNGTNGHHDPPSRTITVLVTGFGPFQARFPINPSYEITKSLPITLPPSAALPDTTIRIIAYPTPIRVSYEEVGHLLPKLHDEYAGTVDLVLHIGMASGRKYYAAERLGHRDGYQKNKDLDGVTPDPDHGATLFPDCPSQLTTSLPYAPLLASWRSHLSALPASSPAHGADIHPSDDAGHYLCDWTYFHSLAYFGRRSGCLEGGDPSARPVVFLHVPAESEGVMIERGTGVAVALIRGMVEGLVGGSEGEAGESKAV